MRQLPASGASERDVVFAVRELIDGRGNNTGTVTLAAGASSTVVTRTNCNENAQVLLSAKTENAAAALPTTWVESVTKDGFTIRHALSGQTDRTFAYEVKGG